MPRSRRVASSRCPPVSEALRHRIRSTASAALLGLCVFAGSAPARAGNLDVQLCNTANVAVFDCFDLVVLYNATDGDNWTNNSHWGSPDVDAWHGVIVDPLSNRVISLDLAQNGLDGQFPPQMYGLQALRFLQLSGNGLDGPLPDYIGNLSALEFLQIGFNDLSGPLPASLGKLTQLDNLFLGGNRFSGPIPASIGNLTRLEVLDIFSDSVDAGSRLTGQLPDLSRLTRLRRLELEGNRLGGPLPAYLAQLTLLEDIRLRGNQFSGTLPAGLGNLANLRHLDLAANEFSGALPATLGNLGQLELLDLSSNAFTSNLPPSLGNLTRLRTLRIAGSPYEARQQITGTIPAALANLVQLEELDLAFNRLSGALPECLGELANLRLLSVQANDLVGAVPEAYTALDLDALYIGLNFLDADASGRLLTSPGIDAWLDTIPVTVDAIPGVGSIDSRDQRLAPVDADAVFGNGFESAAGSGCPGF
jgi:Leucine-rich repeat (LRR) protein